MRTLMLAEEKRLQNKIAELEAALHKLPEGTFYSAKDGNRIRWFRYHNGKCSSIRKTEQVLAQDLAHKNFITFQLKEARTELDAVRAYLRNASLTDNEKYLEDNPEIRRLLFDKVYNQNRSQNTSKGNADGVNKNGNLEAGVKYESAEVNQGAVFGSNYPVNSQNFDSKAFSESISDKVKAWACAEYKKSDYPFKGTTYKTLKGDIVKSAAEKNIADALFLAGIPYRYECGISFDNGRNYYYPDFMIMDPRTGDIYIWEHFGMTEINYYRHKNANKMYVYFDNGFIPGKNLICTSSDDKYGLTQLQIEQTIDYYFK